MFRVQDVILSEEIATEKFACNLTKCKGACCVVGDAGAPVGKDEIPILRKAFRELREDLAPEAVEKTENEGLILGNSEEGYELNCIESGECVFVTKDESGIAKCAIQEAYYQGRLNWEKPISCHLYPIRLKSIGGLQYANFEYIPELCSAGCAHGESSGTYLAEFLREALVRRYGQQWFDEFLETCNRIRNKK